VGRPGLDPGTLRVFRDGAWTSAIVQISWSDEKDCPSVCVEMFSELKTWLDRNGILGTVKITFAE
jgi:hypothetical protein